MASAFNIINMSRHFRYTILLNGHESGEIDPLKTSTLSIEPGQHELSFKDGDPENIPTHCKPIQVTIADGNALNIKVLTDQFSIRIFDEHGMHLNGIRGFLCGKVGKGIHIENQIA